jgi:hypothetical protein
VTNPTHQPWQLQTLQGPAQVLEKARIARLKKALDFLPLSLGFSSQALDFLPGPDWTTGAKKDEVFGAAACA